MNNFNEYEANVAITAMYPGHGDGNTVSLSYLTLGLCGESGEVAEKVKKWIRDGVIDKQLVAKELGDVLWYLTRTANELGFSLEDVADMNIKKLTSRKERGVLQGNGDER